MSKSKFSVGVSGPVLRELEVTKPARRSPKQQQLERVKIELVILIGFLMMAIMFFIYADHRQRELDMRLTQPAGRVGTFSPSLREEFPEQGTFR